MNNFYPFINEVKCLCETDLLFVSCKRLAMMNIMPASVVRAVASICAKHRDYPTIDPAQMSMQWKKQICLKIIMKIILPGGPLEHVFRDPSVCQSTRWEPWL